MTTQSKKSPGKRKKILFVCTGNTCRSPMAEAILNKIIKERKIKWWKAISRGIQAETKSSISSNALTALQEIGIYVEKFKPKQLKEKDIEDSVMVIFMTENQKSLYIGHDNVYCVKDICGYDIPDPYGYKIERYRDARDAIYGVCEYITEIMKDYDEVIVS